MTNATDRLLFALKRRGPCTAADLAEVLAVSPQAVREQLATLAGQDLVVYDDRVVGRGRPRRMWRVADAARARFPDTHAELTVEVIGLVRRELGEAAFDQLLAQRETRVLAHYRARLAGAATLAERLTCLADARSAEGYMAEVVAADEGGWWLVEHHCPICAAARSCQGFCRSELDVFRAVLGPDVEVTRSEHLLAGGERCVYRVTEIADREARPGTATQCQQTQ